jgi:hypothetical protein
MKVGLDQKVMFVAIDPVTHRAGGFVYAVFENQSYVRINDATVGEAGAVRIGDLAAVLPK